MHIFRGGFYADAGPSRNIKNSAANLHFGVGLRRQLTRHWWCACGTGNAEAFLQWVVEHSGKPFVFSTLFEEVAEPRWKSDWLSGNHLISDTFGRIDAAVRKIPEASRPAEWVARIEKTREWISEQHFEPLSVLPAIGESARRKQPALEETYPFHSSFQKLCDKPSVDALIDCTPGIYILGVPKEVTAACHIVLAHLQKTFFDLTENNTQFALQLLSYVAVLAQDEGLVDSVAQFAVEKVRELNNGDSTLEIICRLVECSGAIRGPYKGGGGTCETVGSSFVYG